MLLCFFFFKQKTAYEMRISDWSSDVCSSDLARLSRRALLLAAVERDAAAAAPLAAGFRPRRRQLGRRMADIDPNSAKAKDIAVHMEQARKAGDLLTALSHESRMRILCIRAEGAKSGSELEELLSMPPAAVSQQPARLPFDR